MGAQARGPRLVGAHATRSGREKFDYFSIIFDYFSAAPPPNLVGGGARTNFSIRGRPIAYEYLSSCMMRTTKLLPGRRMLDGLAVLVGLVGISRTTVQGTQDIALRRAVQFVMIIRAMHRNC